MLYFEYAEQKSVARFWGVGVVCLCVCKSLSYDSLLLSKTVNRMAACKSLTINLGVMKPFEDLFNLYYVKYKQI